MAALLVKYIVREFWNTTKLNGKEKLSFKKRLIDRIADLNAKIAFHIVSFNEN
jgi:hypothetical protein